MRWSSPVTAGDEVHLLGGGDRIYRQFIETIREGTATVSAGGEILQLQYQSRADLAAAARPAPRLRHAGPSLA